MANATDPIRYETTFITRTDLTDEQLKSLWERVTGAIKKFDGDIVKSEDWGKKRMAYPIQKESRGQYSHFVYTGNNSAVAEVERNLRLQESVIRFMTVKEEERTQPSISRRDSDRD
jgi:small subunit ribosomal protein S6